MHPRVVVAIADDAVRHEALTYCRFLASTNTVEAPDARAMERAVDPSFDLLVLDAEMPGIALEALLDRFAASIEGRRRIVLFTDRVLPPGKYPPGMEILPKPFRIESLNLALDQWRESISARPLQDRAASAQTSPHPR